LKRPEENREISQRGKRKCLMVGAFYLFNSFYFELVFLKRILYEQALVDLLSICWAQCDAKPSLNAVTNDSVGRHNEREASIYNVVFPMPHSRSLARDDTGSKLEAVRSLQLATLTGAYPYFTKWNTFLTAQLNFCFCLVSLHCNINDDTIHNLNLRHVRLYYNSKTFDFISFFLVYVRHDTPSSFSFPFLLFSIFFWFVFACLHLYLSLHSPHSRKSL
jgi:hypothetical protein